MGKALCWSQGVWWRGRGILPMNSRVGVALESATLQAPLSLASISSPENWHHWSSPWLAPDLPPHPSPSPLHLSGRVSILLAGVPCPAQTLSGDTWVKE